ncbi:MAG: hypothetical protein HOG12_15860 [Alphaproteobacteria bacterium]|nr:hypothetical protein [Alphaproteobacteria bacterium]MBT4888771.1 hypothetical protein [Rhodospirillales bacterium]
MAALEPVPDFDRDAIHVLPLSIIPLELGGLRRLRMVKNDELESVIEIFGGDSGSGHIKLSDLSMVYPNLSFRDNRILQKLAKLSSYDVYCLRVHLRALEINVDEDEHLKLSGDKQTELRDYMSRFTKRLIMEVFGDDDQVTDFKDVLALYRNPDKTQAAKKLAKLAQSLGIDVHAVPAFLEDYGDIYLSIAYYREYLETVQEGIADFEISIADILEHPHLGKDQSLVNICKRSLRKIKKLNEAAMQRFEVFEQYTDQMWENMDTERFQSFKSVVINNHTALGGVLCILSVKMNAWMHKFPMQTSGGLFNRAEFIRVKIQRGL